VFTSPKNTINNTVYLLTMCHPTKSKICCLVL